METMISRLNNARTQQKNIVAIFDIDSTIFNVTPRNQEILNLYLEAHKLKSLSHKLEEHHWGVESFITKLLSIEEKLMARKFWTRHFFSGTFLWSDQLYTKVKELLLILESIGAKIHYLTGRDNERMRSGTLKQLKYWGLPLADNARLITKEHRSLPDGAYKRGKIERLLNGYDSHSTEFFFFDNEPVVLSHCLFEGLKNYTPVFIESTHSNRMKPDLDWLTIKTSSYNEIYNSIKAF